MASFVLEVGHLKTGSASASATSTSTMTTRNEASGPGQRVGRSFVLGQVMEHRRLVTILPPHLVVPALSSIPATTPPTSLVIERSVYGHWGHGGGRDAANRPGGA